MTGEVVLFGARYSVYVRAVLMTLEAKGVNYDLQPVDIFNTEEDTSAYRQIQPFGRIPALQHGDFTLYETCAINRYVDEAFNGPALQPDTPPKRARMTQIISIADSYGYWPLIRDIYVESVSNPNEGKATDKERIALALPRARTYLHALDLLINGRGFLADDRPTLADFHTAPMFGYFVETPEGREMLGDFPELVDWWERISTSDEWRVAGEHEKRQ